MKRFSRSLLRLAPVVLPITMLLILQPSAAQTLPPLFIAPDGNNKVQISWPPGNSLTVLEEIFSFDVTDLWHEVPVAPSVLGTQYQVLRGATNGTGFFRLAQRGTPGVSTLPDTATTAPALAQNQHNDQAASTTFLYTGVNAVQFGVAPGIISPMRAAVLRGKVKKRDSSPLADVRVAIRNHPEFGYTFTRADGMFDLAVNSAAYTVDFEAIGYCPVQRQVMAPKQDFRTLEDVALVPMDPVATLVAFGLAAPLQVALSSTQTDRSGTRSASLIIPAGTCADVILPDGSTQACSSLTLRMTEFTVGPNGPAAMPAPLPPSSAYTYCAEFTADEAVNAGARTVRFNQKVWCYVDNFLRVPVGTMVPNGTYNREIAAWEPAGNGVVIKILGTTSGLAQVDMNGDDVAENAEALTAWDFTTAELQRLAVAYLPGTSLMRAPLTHFSSWDLNFGVVRGVNLVKAANQRGDKPVPKPEVTADGYGSVGLETQVFQEAVPLVGIPMALHYSSDRVPGSGSGAKFEFPLNAGGGGFSDANGLCPGPEMSFEVTYEIAGVVTEKTYFDGFASRAALSLANNVAIRNCDSFFTNAVVQWNGLDAYGRFVGGTRAANVRVVAVFPLRYSLQPIGDLLSAISTQPLFGNFGGESTTAIAHGEAGRLAAVIDFSRDVTLPDVRKQPNNVGGWTLTPHHQYDLPARTVYLGDGRTIGSKSLNNGVGTFEEMSRLVGQDASITSVAAAPDGTLFFHDRTSGSLFKRDADGRFSWVTSPVPTQDALGPIINFSGAGFAEADGQPARRFYLSSNMHDMAVGTDDSLYCRVYHQIFKIDPSGVLHVIMGLPGALPPSPLEGSGFEARTTYAGDNVNYPRIAVGQDGAVYYNDEWIDQGFRRYFLRKIAPDGRVYTLAGQGGTLDLGGFNQLDWHTNTVGKVAREALLGKLSGLAVSADGTLYVGATQGDVFAIDGVFKITPGGMTEMVLWNPPAPGPAGGNPVEGSEGKVASQPFYPGIGGSITRLRMAADDTLTFLVGSGSFAVPSLWRVDANGVLQRLVGRLGGEGAAKVSQMGNPLQTLFPNSGITAYAIGPDNGVTCVNQTGSFQGSTINWVQYIGPALAGFNGQDLSIPSEDGTELFVFDPYGRHLRTLNSLTGSTNWLFGYDAHNRVTALSDANGRITKIERDGSGEPTAIVGPYGDRTTLGLDASGWLKSVANPLGETARMTNSALGLLQSITGPRGHTFTVGYDVDGRVVSVGDPLGGGRDLVRTNLYDPILEPTFGANVNYTSTTTLTNIETRQTWLRPDGSTVRDSYSPDGARASETIQPDDRTEVAYFPGGTSVKRVIGSSPQFPSQTRLVESEAWFIPGGPSPTFSVARSGALADPTDATSLIGLTNVATINGNNYTTTYTRSNRVVTATSPEGRQTRTELDALGRISRQEAAGQPTVEIVYDAQGRMSEVTDTAASGARQTRFTYNAAGRLDAAIDPLGRTNRFAYDGAGRLQRLTLTDNQIADFGFDSEYNLTSVTPPGRPAHRFENNAVGLVTKYSPPVVNTLDDSIQYVYDADRQLTRVAFPDGQEAQFTRGPGGRVDRLALGSGPTLNYTYAPFTGRLTNIISSAGDELHFEHQGPLPVKTTWVGSVKGSLGLVFNADLQPVSQSVNQSAPVMFAYDRDGLLKQAGGLALTRDAASGLVTATSLGQVTDERGWDDRGRLTNYIAKVGATPVWSAAYQYDLLGRLTHRVEITGTTQRTLDYAYDTGGRLAEVRQNGLLVTTYAYDANGNRTSRNGETATYDAQDRVLTHGAASFVWSRNGDLRTRTAGGQTTEYTYDLRGDLAAVKLLSGSQIEYLRDALGRRIGRKLNGTLQRGWLWDGGQVAAEVDGSSVVTSRFVYAADGTAPSLLIKGSKTYRIVSDERGSVRLVVDIADGTVAQQLDYDEFGRVVADTAPGFQPFSFAGGLYDADTGLVRFGARDYSAETGQWTARDPIDFEGGQLSLYAYVGYDPVNVVDPSGTGPYGGRGGDRGDPPPGSVVATVREIKQVQADGGRVGLLLRHKGSSQWIAARVGDKISVGDDIKTTQNSGASLDFLLGGRVGINTSSEIRISNERGVEVIGSSRRKGGGLFQKTVNLKEPLEIHYSGGVMGIKG